MAWVYRSGRVDEPRACSVDGCRLPGVYRIRAQSEQGTTVEQYRCCNHAAALHYEKGLPFPPGMWDRTDAAAMAEGPAPAPPEQLVHHCHARGCHVAVPPKLLMCMRHWKMVPRDLQAAVWREYVPGQEERKDPTRSYLDVMEQAIAAVAVAEAKPARPPKVHQIPLHAKPTTCESCGETIVFIPTQRQKLMPVEVFGPHKGESHFIHCPNAAQHRRA